MGSKTKDYSEEFFNKAKTLHNNQYDYSNSIYVNSRIAINIKCTLCNTEFNQKPNEHIRIRKTPVRGMFTNTNGGCPTCRIETLRKARTKGKDEYIQKANLIHGNCYDYSETEEDILNTPCYGDKKIKITIKCKEHGAVKVSKLNHIDKAYPQICPLCSEYRQKLIDLTSTKGNTDFLENLGKNIPTIFYIIKFENFYKYGLTTRSIKERYRTVKKDYTIVQEISTTLDIAIKLEQIVEQYCLKLNLKIRPKLLEGNGSTECFTI